MKLGASLVAIARQRAGLSQRALAERLGVPPSTVARWESGEHAPSMDTVQTVSRACGLELTYGLAIADDSYVFDVQRRLQLTPTERVRALTRTCADPLHVAAALYRADVRYVLIGTVAAAARGWPILLGRGEYLIVPEDATRNIARLEQAADALGAGERKVEDLYAGAEVTWRWPLAGDGSLAAVKYPLGTRGYRDLRRAARETALQDAVVDVASLRDLIRMADASPGSQMRPFLPALWATLEQTEDNLPRPGQMSAPAQVTTGTRESSPACFPSGVAPGSRRVEADFLSLPGHDLIGAGIRDLAAGRESEASLLVAIAAPRLRALGVAVPDDGAERPSHRLYERLSDQDPGSAHSRYNALLARVASFSRAAEHAPAG